MSTPNESNFTITNNEGIVINKGTTPATIRLKSNSGTFKRAEYQIVFNKKGYVDSTVSISAKIDAWYLGNLVGIPLFGVPGLVGLLIDSLSGAMYELKENYVTGVLNKELTNSK